jgi:hypothetical protein
VIFSLLISVARWAKISLFIAKEYNCGYRLYKLFSFQISCHKLNMILDTMLTIVICSKKNVRDEKSLQQNDPLLVFADTNPSEDYTSQTNWKFCLIRSLKTFFMNSDIFCTLRPSSARAPACLGRHTSSKLMSHLPCLSVSLPYHRKFIYDFSVSSRMVTGILMPHMTQMTIDEAIDLATTTWSCKPTCYWY